MNKLFLYTLCLISICSCGKTVRNTNYDSSSVMSTDVVLNEFLRMGEEVGRGIISSEKINASRSSQTLIAVGEFINSSDDPDAQFGVVKDRVEELLTDSGRFKIVDPNYSRNYHYILSGKLTSTRDYNDNWDEQSQFRTRIKLSDDKGSLIDIWKSNIRKIKS